MASIFISYRREPTAAWAGRLHDRLAPHFGRDNVFLDVDLVPGDDFVAVLEDRVSQCDVLIALIGRDWQPERLARPEDWVRLEIEVALRRNVRVIPVLVDGVKMPVADVLPESLKALTRRHALDLNHVSFHRDVEALIRAIERVVTPGATSKREPFVHPVDGQRYVWIPPGKFMMGASPGDNECYDEEKPAHEVEITRGFWLGETPVTQAAWRKVMGTSPSRFKGDDRPVESVSWNEAAEYCRKVGGRLPTEAEWEYAARAGTTGARYGELDAIAWYEANSQGGTKSVRGKQPNPFGLYDMLGNVCEWTADWWSGYEPQSASDPKGPQSGEGKVVRGGSWVVDPRDVRSSVRINWIDMEDRDDNLGFRCAGEFR